MARDFISGKQNFPKEILGSATSMAAIGDKLYVAWQELRTTHAVIVMSADGGKTINDRNGTPIGGLVNKRTSAEETGATAVPDL